MWAATSTLLDVWTGTEFWGETAAFLSLTLQGLGIALFLGIPAGVLLTRAPRVAPPVINVLALLQTFPSLALLGLLIPIPWLGLSPPAYVLLAVLYSLFPITMNTYVGITQVSPAIRDAARGMGMTGGQVLWNVDLPLAFPVLLAGVRTASVASIGIITVCALAGAGSLGLYIVRGMTRSNIDLILTGVIPILALTLLVFWGLGAVSRLAQKNSRLGLLLGGGTIVLLSLFAAGAMVGPPLVRALTPQDDRPTIRLASKNFVEGEILTEVLKQMLEAHTDFRIEVKANLTPDLIYKAILNGDIDLYPEYTGNLLTAPDALNQPVPRDRAIITDLVRREMRGRYHLVLLDLFGFNNEYVMCVPRSLARQYNLRNISDIPKRGLTNLRTMVDHDFLDRPDGWPGLVKTYGLDLPKPRQAAPDQRYAALEAGQTDMVAGYTTDWQIKAYGLVMLKDDKGYFPTYHGAPLVREDVLEKHPEIAVVLNRLAGQIDDDTMRQLNFQDAGQKRSVADVARQFLRDRNLLTPAKTGPAK
jgi:osmoprotectant transport system permease protein